MNLFILCCFLLITSCSTHGNKKRYDGYQLMQVSVESEKHREIITRLSNDIELDFWREGQTEVDILVPPHKVDEMREVFQNENMPVTVNVFNMQNLLDEEEAGIIQRRKARKQVFDYDDYNDLDSIFVELDALVSRCPSALTCETIVHGRSYEGRDIKGIRIRRTDRVQKKIWIDATIHAREWLATATNLKIIRHIVEDYNSDAALRDLVDRYDWYLLPVVNSDGYVFTFTDNRLWRKNRRPNAGSTCIGTDLNRNFADNQWGTSGSSTNPCSETFRGASPGSEPEVQAMQLQHNAMGQDILLSVNLHTYGRMWLNSWSYQNVNGSCYIGPDHNDLMAVSNAAADAVQSTYNTVWTRGPFCLVLYPGSGTSIDYAKGISGVKYTFLPELRGSNFVISPDNIQPSFVEVWNGIKAAINTIERNN